MALSSNQRILLTKLLATPNLRLTIDELTDRGRRGTAVGAAGAVVKALQATGLVVVEGGVARLDMDREPGPFEGYGESRFAPQLMRNREVKEAAAEFVANVLAGELHGVPRICIDNGSAAAACFRALTVHLLDVPAPQQPRVSWVIVNPIVASYVARMSPIGDLSIAGGDLNWDKVSFEGPAVEAFLESVPAIDVACLGVARASSDGHLGQPSETMTQQKTRIIQKAAHVVIPLDDSKIVSKCTESSCDIYRRDGADLTVPTLQRILAEPRRVTLVIATAVKSLEDASPAVRDLVKKFVDHDPKLAVYLVSTSGKLLAGSQLEHSTIRRAG